MLIFSRVQLVWGFPQLYIWLGERPFITTINVKSTSDYHVQLVDIDLRLMYICECNTHTINPSIINY